jgi:hypothetical protein
MADGNFLATYLNIGVDYEFGIKTVKFNYTSFQNVRFLQKKKYFGGFLAV